MITEYALPPHRVLTDLMRLLESQEVEAARRLLEAHHSVAGELAQLLRENRLGGYFHTLVRETHLADLFPRRGYLGLEEQYLDQVERNRRIKRLLGGIAGRFEELAIPFLTMKGLYLSQRFFGDVNRRFMWDLDLLVRSADLEASLAAIRSLGLEPSSGMPLGISRRLWGVHAVELRGEGGKLDLHFAPRVLAGIHFDGDAMWKGAMEFELSGLTLPTLGDEDTLLVAAVGVGTDIQRGALNLRKVWDIYMMLKALDSSADWPAFLDRREAEGSLKLVINVFAFVGNLLGTMDDWPRLGAAMADKDQLVLITSESEARTVFARERGEFANRLLFSRLLPVSPASYWSRWLLTVPLRRIFYREDLKKRRQKKRSQLDRRGARP